MLAQVLRPFVMLGVLCLTIALLATPVLAQPKGADKRHYTPDGLVATGSPAPDFTLPATVNSPVSLKHLRGKNVVLVFYPMDQTPGCTLQLCRLRDDEARFKDSNTVILAVNPASLSSHQAFAKAQNYRFPLLVDRDHQVAKAYGAYAGLGFNQRTVYIIDTRGIVRYAKRGMPSNEELLAIITGLKGKR